MQVRGRSTMRGRWGIPSCMKNDRQGSSLKEIQYISRLKSLLLGPEYLEIDNEEVVAKFRHKCRYYSDRRVSSYSL